MFRYSCIFVLVHFCILMLHTAANGNDSNGTEIISEYGNFYCYLDEFNIDKCLEKAWTEVLLMIKKYYSDELMKFVFRFPFIPEVLNDSEKYNMFCNLTVKKMYLKLGHCGNWMTQPSSYLCLNKNEIISEAKCLTDAANVKCITNCTQVFNSSSYANCKMYHCFLSCVECKQILLSYYYYTLIDSGYSTASKLSEECQSLFNHSLNHFPNHYSSANYSDKFELKWRSCNCTHYPLRDFDAELIPPEPIFDYLCIKQCFLKCTSYVKATSYYNQHQQSPSEINLVCNVTKCAQDIKSIIFTENTRYGDWFDVVNTENSFQIALSEVGLAQLSLNNKADFEVRFVVYTIKMTKSSCEVNRLNYTKDLYGGRATIDGRLSVNQTRQSFNKIGSWEKTLFYFELDFELANGFINHSTVFIPDIAKTIFPTKPPDFLFPQTSPPHFRNFVGIVPIVYSKFNIEIYVQWSCPEYWNSKPIGYNVMCKTTPISFNNYAFWRQNSNTLSEVDLKLLPPDPKFWYDSHPYADTVLEKWVPWTEKFTSFWLHSNIDDLAFYYDPRTKSLSSLHVMCRVQAVSSMGPSKWRYSHNDITSFVAVDMAMFETHDNKTNLWLYQFSHVDGRFRGGEPIYSSKRLLIDKRHNITKVIKIENQLLPVGCYDWIADYWYMAVNRAADNSVWLAKTEETSTGIPHLNYLVRLNEIPYQILCYPTISRIIWSTVSGKEVRIFNYTLNGGVQEFNLKQYQCNDCDIEQNDRFATPAISHDCTSSGYASLRKDLTYTYVKGYTLGYGHVNVILHMFSGIWRFRLDTCLCSQLINTKKLEQISGRMAKDVKYIAINQFVDFSLLMKPGNESSNIIKIDFELNLIPGNLTDRKSLEKIFDMELASGAYSPIQSIIPLNEHQFEKLPWFPSHISKSATIVQRMSTMTQFHPLQPQACFFPNASVIRMKPSGPHTTQLNIKLVWNDSSSCKIISKPKIMYEVKYKPVTAKHVDEVCIGSKCTCHKDSQCRRWSSGITSERKSYTATLTDLESDTTFYVEVSVRPDLGNFEHLWYGDNVEPRVSSSTFSSHYNPPNNKTLLALLGTFTAILIIVFGFLYYMYQKKWYIYQQIQKLSAEQIDIKSENKIGSGHFGEVFKVDVNYDWKHFCGFSFHTKNSPCRTLAIKKLKESANDKDKKAFLEEAILLSKLENDYIVMTMGICMDSRPIMLALEYCDGGSLDVYLQNEEVQEQITNSDLYSISLDVLKGCHHLERNAIVHRDVSAKNCLVCQKSHSVRPSIVKISDFGLALTLPSKSKQIELTDVLELPVAHTAPEGFGGKFSSKSDVWSYGVALWEIWSWGAVPFYACAIHKDDDSSCPMMPFKKSEIKNVVSNAESPRSLEHWQIPCGANFTARDEIQQIMISCWTFQVDTRPTFTDLLRYIKEAKSQILQKEINRPVRKVVETIVQQQSSKESNHQSSQPVQLSSSQNRNTVSQATSFVEMEPFYSKNESSLGNSSNQSDRHQVEEVRERSMLSSHGSNTTVLNDEPSLLIHHPGGNLSCRNYDMGIISMRRMESIEEKEEREELLNDEGHAIASSLLQSGPCEKIESSNANSNAAIELKILK